MNKSGYLITDKRNYHS